MKSIFGFRMHLFLSVLISKCKIATSRVIEIMESRPTIIASTPIRTIKYVLIRVFTKMIICLESQR